jgi:hypothetical protein
MTTKQRLLEIANAVENWPTMHKDDAEVAISVSTPAGAVEYIVSKHIPTSEERMALRAVLPSITTSDFAAAALRIRQVADALT